MTTRFREAKRYHRHTYCRFCEILITAGLLALTGLVPPEASGQVFLTRSGFAEFTSSVPLHEFTGESDHLVGQINLSEETVDFFIDLATLETGITKRDKDMLETLEADEYPFAEFFGSLDSPIDPSIQRPQPALVSGDFTIHGVTREIEVNGTITPGDEGLLVEASWILNLDDYDIEPPSLLVVKVDEEQEIRIRALLEPESN